MKVNGVTKWMVVDHQATSLFNQIADGGFRATSAGRDQWLSLIDGSSLQAGCNKEGFNFRRKNDYKYFIKTRIGFVANNQNDCYSPDSCIGFGIFVRGCQAAPLNTTCGNVVTCDEHHDVANKDTAAFGFILVQ
jgi:hypothetical protein